MRKLLITLLMVFVAKDTSAQTPMTVHSSTFYAHVVKRAPLVYPPIAKAAQVSGTVVDEVTVSPEGKVIDVRAISGPPMLLTAAANSAREWMFKPFMKDGKEVAATGKLHFVFSLPPAPPPNPLWDFLGKVLPKYVREPILAERGFSCEVDPKWDDFPVLQFAPEDSPGMKWLRGTQLRVVAKPRSPLNVTAKLPNEPKLGSEQLASAKEMVMAAQALTRGFYITWFTFALNGVPFTEQAKLDKAGNVTNIVFVSQGMTDKAVFDKDLILTRFLQAGPNGSRVDETPKFEATPKGLLYVGADTSTTEAGHNNRVIYTLDYQNVGQFHLPKTVALQPAGTFTVHLRFRDCRVNPPTPIPPPPGYEGDKGVVVRIPSSD